MRAREGDLIQTGDNVLFDVKGVIHPPDKVIAFPRYIPSPDGTRGRPGALYNKIYNLAERYTYLQKQTPNLLVADPVFGETLCEVPINQIVKHYDPVEKMWQLRAASKLAPLEQKAVRLAEELQAEAGIPWSSIGISGSVMAGLFTLQSDLDPLVYGEENSRKAYQALQKLQKSATSNFKPYTRNELANLFDFRVKDTIMTFDDFVGVESGKAFQGMYEGVDYFVRFVKDWDDLTEVYGDVCYESVGYAKLSATIADDLEALFTPCTYQITNVTVQEGPKLDNITEIASFRGRFCQQAPKGQKIIVQGKLEQVINKKTGQRYCRVIIGNQPRDYFVRLQV
jgi:predicted nucleotidyltransferase